MNTKKIVRLTTVLTLITGFLFLCYRGVQLYHEVTRPQTQIAPATALLAQPGKLVTTYSFSVVREVVLSAPVAASPRSSQRGK